MPHRFPIKEIARQAVLGTATIDRVLNNRAHVSAQTRQRVTAAIQELEAQEAQLAARGRRLFFDFVVEAPTRFSREVKAAAEAVLPHIGTAVCRPRFLLQDKMPEAEVLKALERIQKRGSHGLCLKARDTEKIRAAVNRLVAAGIPVITLVTDLPTTDRRAYVGLDNAGAGRTAAYLIYKPLGPRRGQVLASRSHGAFLGEEEREQAFLLALRSYCPQLTVLTTEGGGGLGFETSRMLEQTLDHSAAIRAVYSMGGGNRAILQTLAERGQRPDVYVAHDLDQENRALLQAGQLDYVLHHDLQHDIAGAFHQFLAHHRLTTDLDDSRASTVQVLTPANIPMRPPLSRP